MLIYLDQIADKKLKAPSTDDASKSLTGNIYSSSTASIRTAGGLSVEKRASIGQLDGRVPLGAVLAVIGTYSATDNLGTFTTASGIPASGVISDDGFMRCDGSLIPVDQDAKLSGFVPRIDDDRFIQGSTSAGLASVTNLSSVNQGNNFVKLGVPELPNHNHNGSTGSTNPSHTHPLTAGVAQGLSPDFGDDTPDSSIESPQDRTRNKNFSTGSSSDASHTHSISPQGGGLAFDIRPRYISGIYLIRVR